MTNDKRHGNGWEHLCQLEDILLHLLVGPVVHHQAGVVADGPVRQRPARLLGQGVHISEKDLQTKNISLCKYRSRQTT